MTKILNEAILSPRSRSRLEMVKVLNQAGTRQVPVANLVATNFKRLNIYE